MRSIGVGHIIRYVMIDTRIATSYRNGYDHGVSRAAIAELVALSKVRNRFSHNRGAKRRAARSLLNSSPAMASIAMTNLRAHFYGID